jgi:tetratricopeptide (TPR) repeat protein
MAQVDPRLLQHQAIQRIEDYIANLRKTGDPVRQRSWLQQAEAELVQSNRIFAARGNAVALAVGLIQQGHAYRLQGQHAMAIPFYQEALAIAQRGQVVSLQADSLAWQALSRFYKDETGQAFADATQAVRLAVAAGDKDILARALDVLSKIQIKQRDFVGAADTIQREMLAASQAKDPMALCYALTSRSDLHITLSRKCDNWRI